MMWLRIQIPMLLALLAWGRPLMAQFELPNLVSGTGSVSLIRAPEKMRLQITIMGRGATLKDALSALQDRVSKAQTQLATLGAEKETIKVGDSRISELPNERNQQRQLQIMMMQRMKQRGGKGATKAPAAAPVLVTAQLTADWKLSSKTAEELLLAVHPIQEKIKAADLAGSKEAEKLSPEQEEMLEEAEQSFGFNSGDEQKPGEPAFMFVNRVSEAEREKALADAFEKAKAKATRLARAAGARLGALRSLSTSDTGGAGFEDYSMNAVYGSYASRAMQMLRQQQGATPANDDEMEAVGVEPGMVRYNVTITASFTLEH
ncbi:MAG: SIMPL domain-containing protein [Planctomycetaceae bacterium]